MTQEYTFSMIKPDATKRNLIGKINSYLENNGLKIVAQKMTILTRDQAEIFYAEHKSRAFFNSLIESITSGPVVLQVLKGENAVLQNRKIMGATNPNDAELGTIRKDFAKNIEENSIHGSDTLESAEREVRFFFAEKEIVE
ncbi:MULTISPECIES: nucleoside-diphosphate kinase [Rickettsieae]|uniref:nucleoside-diphosphate kinase n=1 Tax=Rickettsieae TaxID=33988 RepID=UPI000B9A2CED|nr:nucleoside-diphosphate kinase [Rickettsia endosymbiont of Culicoides newsteadi]MDN3030629.1 nucleoside-diphosphate kinase [Candidatus Tisiphia sp.]OZG32161.1 nucleoside-diphosphate kinase [Rickettsia endosymbiont of Culicoides newsteadi]HJD56884.1 nucleoside-diphosphate kinase [Rickettsia endosymbiont of Sericostoma sp. HW-2014]HJD63597.1 nucleoside-diphosphate kinase [Rickettsia endosymbiont of Sericostoma sp.]